MEVDEKIILLLEGSFQYQLCQLINIGKLLNIFYIFQILNYNLQNDPQIQVKVESDENQTYFIQNFMLANKMNQPKTQLLLYKRFQRLPQNHSENLPRELPQYCINNFYNNSKNQVNRKYYLHLNQISAQFQFNKVELDQNSEIILLGLTQAYKIQYNLRFKILLKNQLNISKPRQQLIFQKENHQKELLANNDGQNDSQQHILVRPKIIRKDQQFLYSKKYFQTLLLLLYHLLNIHGIIGNSSQIYHPNYLVQKKKMAVIKRKINIDHSKQKALKNKSNVFKLEQLFQIDRQKQNEEE
ncbi:hypothetical protein pb186bvf_009075 [Paramecium bursaria]